MVNADKIKELLNFGSFKLFLFDFYLLNTQGPIYTYGRFFLSFFSSWVFKVSPRLELIIAQASPIQDYSLGLGDSACSKFCHSKSP